MYISKSSKSLCIFGSNIFFVIYILIYIVICLEMYIFVGTHFCAFLCLKSEFLLIDFPAIHMDVIVQANRSVNPNLSEVSILAWSAT